MKEINGVNYYTVKEVKSITGATGDQLVYILRKDIKREEKGEERRLPPMVKLDKLNYWPVALIDEIIEGIEEHNRTKFKNGKKVRPKVKRLSTKAKLIADATYEVELYARLTSARKEHAWRPETPITRKREERRNDSTK